MWRDYEKMTGLVERNLMAKEGRGKRQAVLYFDALSYRICPLMFRKWNVISANKRWMKKVKNFVKNMEYKLV